MMCFLPVSQHFAEMGVIEVSETKLQVVAAEQPDPPDHKEHSASSRESVVPPSPVVKVSWAHDDLSKQILTMYLENQKRSGGGQIQDLRFFAKERIAYVIFDDAECKLQTLLKYIMLLLYKIIL